MDANNINDIKTRVSKIENIRSFLSVDRTGKDYRTTSVLKESFYILGLENIESYYLLLDLFVREDQLVLKQEKYNVTPYPFYDVRAITKDNQKYKLIFINQEDLAEYLRNISAYTTIYDKDRYIRKLDKADKQEIVREDIDSETFKEEGILFFLSLIDVAASLSKRDLIVANYLYDDVKSQLLKMVDLYILQKYNYKISIGPYGEQIEMHLDKDYYRLFQELFRTADIDQFWTAIFNCASLYRKLGLEVSRTLDLPYPKEEDVDSLNYVRFLYDNFGRNS